MPTKSGDRSQYFPAIEKKYGQPMQFWFDRLSTLTNPKYEEQIALLREGHGFSQAHANAVVMYVRGSTTSKRHASVEDYLKTLDAQKRATVTAILDAIRKRRPKMEIVMAWNQPMCRWNGKYVFGISVSKNHILIAPFDASVISEFEDRLQGYKVNKKTIQVPVDWKVNASLVNDLVTATINADSQ